MQVTLSDHTGIAPNGAVVDHDQWIVHVDNVQVGYLPKQDGAWLQCIVFMDESSKAEVLEAVGLAAKQSIGGAAMPVDPDLEPHDDEDDNE